MLKRIVVPVLGALLLASCAGTGDSMAEPAEAVCVISGEPAEGGPTAEFMGQTVNFCCDRCKSKWDGMNEEAKKAAVAAMK